MRRAFSGAPRTAQSLSALLRSVDQSQPGSHLPDGPPVRFSGSARETENETEMIEMSGPRPIDSDEDYQRRKALFEKHEEEERLEIRNSLISTAVRLTGLSGLATKVITRNHDE